MELFKTIFEGLMVTGWVEEDYFIKKDDDTFDFDLVDPNCNKWGINRLSESTVSRRVDIYKLMEEANHKQMFSDPDKHWLSFGAIRSFYWGTWEIPSYLPFFTYFLIKCDNGYFVTRVYQTLEQRTERGFRSKRGITVYKFEDDVVHFSGSTWVVIPQLKPWSINN